MLFQENPTIAAIDDTLAALSAIRECVLIVTRRNRDSFRGDDFAEMQRILDACDRLQAYELVIRAGETERHLAAIETD